MLNVYSAKIEIGALKKSVNILAKNKAEAEKRLAEEIKSEMNAVFGGNVNVPVKSVLVFAV